MSRPKARPDLVDAVRAVVPARVQKKLEGGNPAEAWTWSGATVTTDGGETVTIAGSEPIGPDQITCSCLLSPKCLHVLAVAAALPFDAPVAAPPPAPKRPPAAAGLLDAVKAVVPTRVQKKLEAGNPADGWTWTEGGAGWTVTTGEDTVTVGTLGEVAVEHLKCTCLLSPKCLHVLAVATAIASAPEPGAAVATAAAPAPEPELPPDPAVALDRGQKLVVSAMVRAASAVLLAGATGVGPTSRDDLVRAVHGARAVGLHRMAAAAKRVLKHVRDLQKARPEFALEDLVEDLREILLVARVLDGPTPTQSFVGTARRTYTPVGSLRLVGLCTEAILASTGYGGVATLMCDPSGRLWTVSDVRPDWTPGQKYDTPPDIGGLTLAHRALGRSGLFAQNATASPDGRLGTGGGVKAVRSGASSWSDPGPAALFATDLGTQLDRVFSGRGDWLFLRGQVLGAHDDALILAVPGASFPIRLVPVSDHKTLRYRDNLRILSHAPGLPVQVVGRVVPGKRGTVAAIALGPWKVDADVAELPRLVLPAEWTDRCNLGLDLLQSKYIERFAREPAVVAPPEVEKPDVLDPFGRRVARLALGGRGTLPGDARGAVEREMATLRERLLPMAARVLGQLADASANARTEGGDRLTTAWLTAAVYEQAARAQLHRASWR